MIPQLIDSICSGASPATSDLEHAFRAMLEQDLPPEQVAGLLVALRTRAPEPRTLTALARAVRERARRVHTTARPLIDTCGTGGDGAGTFNISTAAAFVVTACGGAVAKHGNRSVSSKTGSADVLEALGLPLELAPEEAGAMLDATGFAFLFAPAFHPLLARVVPVRRALGVPTLFNLIGPLANPAGAEHQVVGVARPELTEPVARTLAELGSKHALVLHCVGLDEMGLHAPSRGHRVHGGAVRPFAFDPAELGLAPSPVAALAGGSAEENAARMRALLAGEGGPLAEVVALNAGAACFVGGLADSIADGYALARERLASGAAERALQRSLETAQRLTRERVS